MKRLTAIVTSLALSLSLASTTLAQVSPTSEAAPLFTDVKEDHDHYVAIRFLVANDVISGYADGSFKPDNVVNRAEALKFILAGSFIEVPDAVNEKPFTDVDTNQWYAKYVNHAKSLSIVSGNPDGTFTAGNTVTRAGFLKMLLMANRFKPEAWVSPRLYNDVKFEDWYYSYMTYAGHSGLVKADDKNNLYPGKELTRGEVAEIIYLMTIIRNGDNLNLLVSETEQQILQIDRYVAAGKMVAAKRSSELAVDYTQQAYNLAPTDSEVVGLAKVAKAYDFVLTAFIAGIQENADLAKDYAFRAVSKAQEAIDTDENTRPIAEYIQRRAQEVLNQLPK